MDETGKEQEYHASLGTTEGACSADRILEDESGKKAFKQVSSGAC